MINVKKSIFSSVLEMKFWGLQINFLNMTFTLPEDKVLKLVGQCVEVLQ